MAGVGRRVKVRVLESESKLWAKSWPLDLPTFSPDSVFIFVGAHIHRGRP